MQLDKTNIQSGATVPLVAIISNPLSTTNANGMSEIRKVINESANVVHFELNGIDTIDEALSLFAKANPAMIIVNGGDGTIGAVLSAILYKKHFSVVPPIAFLPGGKTNMTAADLGFKGKPAKVLRKLLRIASEGKIADAITSRHLIELDMGDGELPKVGTFFGTAGVVKGIFWTRENAYSMGVPNSLAHVMAFMKLLGSAFGIGKQKDLLVSDPMEITVPGSARMAGQYAAVLATTLDNLILGLKPYGSVGDGGLRFSAIEPGAGNLFRAFKALITGGFKNKSISGTHTRNSNEIRFEGTDPVTLDGEIYQPTAGVPVTLRGDKALTFISIK